MHAVIAAKAVTQRRIYTHLYSHPNVNMGTYCKCSVRMYMLMRTNIFSAMQAPIAPGAVTQRPVTH